MADFEEKIVITNVAKATLSSIIASGSPTFQISAFSVGTGGYLPRNPFIAVPPDPNATGLTNEIFRSQNVPTENIGNSTKVYVCAIQPGDAVGALGELGLWATYLSGPNAGQVFLFAIQNFPVISITGNGSYTWRMVVPI
jgi:hypothetical protein